MLSQIFSPMPNLVYSLVYFNYNLIYVLIFCLAFTVNIVFKEYMNGKGNNSGRLFLHFIFCIVQTSFIAEV